MSVGNLGPPEISHARDGLVTPASVEPSRSESRLSPAWLVSSSAQAFLTQATRTVLRTRQKEKAEDARWTVASRSATSDPVVDRVQS